MTQPWIDPAICTLATLGVGGAALGLVGLLGGGANRGPWRFAAPAVALAVVLLSLAAALLGQPAGVWLPPAALAGLCLTSRLLRSPAVARAAVCLFALVRRPQFQAACLLVGSPAVAVLCTLDLSADEPDVVDSAHDLDELRIERTFEAIEPSPARTDTGAVVAIRRRVQEPAAPAEQFARHSRLLRSMTLTDRVIILPAGPENSNCHGWVFTGGRYWIGSEEVNAIVRDNGYLEVSMPQPGDLVLYRDTDGAVTHTGIVRAGGPEGPVLIESKWGGCGRFIHPPDLHPYGEGTITYYRSPRRGHLLRGLPGAPTYD